jgi:hypothetical protein
MAISFNDETGLQAEETAVIRQNIADQWAAVFSDEKATLLKCLYGIG